eukprot:TRINITY_DN10491_c0_g2_i3.p1 TRINITY_DN10491_c0_g2~~TRINITY_DN10491_c0_g2_i3.p1  ORF type:complete len:545 (-),score=51.44 TRINITY_DN10491_c0_g2_i3:621-2255(-)
MQSENNYESIVSLGGSGTSSCGYCGGEGFVSHGCHAIKLTVLDYQDLIDRGWRRSGNYIYKPTMDKACCPQYTIRLPVENFQISKEQEKVMRKMERYLEGIDSSEKQQSSEQHNSASSSSTQQQMHEEYDAEDLQERNALEQLLQKCVLQLIEQGRLSQECRVEDLKVIKMKKSKSDRDNRRKLTCPVGLKCHRFLIEQKEEQLPLQALDRAKLIADLVYQLMQPCMHAQWELTSQNGHLNFCNQLILNGISQEVRDRSNTVTQPFPQNYNPQELSKHKLEIIEIPNQFIEEEYELYRKYQIAIHGDEEWSVSRGQYRRFLVDTPLIHVSQHEDAQAPPCGYGSFHHQYRIDGKLVAVGVVDILPRCLSSKYFFWDPDYARLSLGKFSAVKEIQWVQEARKTCPDLQYYYMGYYIQSCPKMRYKGDYKPSQLLCPQKFTWVTITPEVEQALDDNKYCILSELNAASENGQEDNDQFQVSQPELSEAVPLQIVKDTQLLIHQSIRLNVEEILERGILRHPQKFLEAVIEWHDKAGPAAQRIALQL